MKKIVKERELAALAARLRKAAGKRPVDVARELRVSQPTVFGAENLPKMSLTKLRVRMIERYSKFKVIGPVYLLEPK
jgi:hypothetical protein